MKLFEHLLRCWKQHNSLKEFKASSRRRFVTLSFFSAAAPVVFSGQVMAASPAMDEASSASQVGRASPALMVRQCDALPQYPLPTDKEKLEQALSAASAVAEHCLKHADFHAWRGALEFSLQRYAEAAESLEGALLLNPDLPGAQLDFAQVLLLQGDVNGAQSLLALLSSREDLPAYLRPILIQAQAQLRAGPETVQTSAARLRVSTALAYDSNLNNAPAASQVTLTFPQGAITLPLDKEYQAKAGAAWLNSAQWQYAHAFGSQVVLLAADVRNRTTSNSSQTGYLQAGLTGYWMQNPAASAQWVGQLNWGELRFGNARLYVNDGASLQRQWKFRTQGVLGRVCRIGLGAELEQRRYPTSSTLDGLYSGALMSATCVEDATPANSLVARWFERPQYGMILRLGGDASKSAARPGGKYDRAELRLSWGANIGHTKVTADYNWTRQLDSEGYSPLFENGAKRHTTRNGLRLVASYPLKSSAWRGAELFAALEVSVQKSNLAAFRTQQKTVMTGLTWDLP